MTIVVGDNGTGMTPDVMEKMFNPFFTTRQTGRNTGLGLSLAYDVIREHGGNIEADSQPGQHTEITVVLPKRSGKLEGTARAGRPDQAEASPVPDSLLG